MLKKRQIQELIKRWNREVWLEKGKILKEKKMLQKNRSKFVKIIMGKLNQRFTYKDLRTGWKVDGLYGTQSWVGNQRG